MGSENNFNRPISKRYSDPLDRTSLGTENFWGSIPFCQSSPTNPPVISCCRSPASISPDVPGASRERCSSSPNFYPGGTPHEKVPRFTSSSSPQVLSCRGVSPPAWMVCSAASSAPLNSDRTIPKDRGLDLIPANTHILTQLPAPVSVAFSLYNTHSKR